MLNYVLGRRYFRYFQFITYFQNAWKTFTGQNEAVARRGRAALSIEVCFLSFYGCYLLLEACTIVSHDFDSESYDLRFVPLACERRTSFYRKADR